MITKITADTVYLVFDWCCDGKWIQQHVIVKTDRTEFQLTSSDVAFTDKEMKMIEWARGYVELSK